jgi:hypothetical protein
VAADEGAEDVPPARRGEVRLRAVAPPDGCRDPDVRGRDRRAGAP